MKAYTKQKILNFIKLRKQVSPREIINWLGFSDQAVFKQLKKLYEAGRIIKIGRPPKVFYFIKKKTIQKPKLVLKPDIIKILEQNYLIITPAGEKKEGLTGFSYWCEKNNLSIAKTADEYVKTWQKYNQYKKGNYIDGTYKLKTTFNQVFMDKLFYLDFYSIERFGKTKLGWLLLYAKQSQDRNLIKSLTTVFKDKVIDLLTKLNISAVGFIPPTIKREVQLIKEMEKNLNLSLSKITIEKAKTPIIVAQKTLSKLEDRIENAQKTIFIQENRVYKNILLIDDAVGSGATMNETARKIRDRGICRGKIYGLAITGSFKGFAVISEI